MRKVCVQTKNVLYLCITKQKTTDMKTNLEIRIEALRTIEKVIVLQKNVFEGCEADEEELEKQLPRIEKIKEWAIANNEIQNIRSWFQDKNFGYHLQFVASEFSKFFHSDSKSLLNF